MPRIAATTRPPARGVPARRGRVLVVDDSAVARALLSRLVDATDRWTVARTVPTVAAALAWLALEPVDVVLLDVDLPDGDGVAALPEFAAVAPNAPVVVMTAAPVAAVEALALGAAEVVTRPVVAIGSRAFGADVLKALARVGDTDRGASEKARQSSMPPSAAGRERRRSVAPAAFDLVAIGASTGGIHALAGVVRRLQPACDVPILVTQHLPASFMPYFAAQLALLAGRPCQVATDRLRVRRGHIVVAPGEAHLHCVALGDGGTGIRLSHESSASGCMPSVDPMFASLAAIHRERLLAVVLSGMGRDGVEGARAVHAAGGCVVAQDSASSTIWGMPGAVVGAGIADAVLAPDAIGALIAAGRRP